MTPYEAESVHFLAYELSNYVVYRLFKECCSTGFYMIGWRF